MYEVPAHAINTLFTASGLSDCKFMTIGFDTESEPWDFKDLFDTNRIGQYPARFLHPVLKNSSGGSLHLPEDNEAEWNHPILVHILRRDLRRVLEKPDSTTFKPMD